MQIARFRSNGRPRYGIVDGDTIIEAQGSPFHGQLRPTNITHSLAAAALLPVSNPLQVFGGVAANYQDHVAQAEETSGRPLGSMGIQPFPKSNASLTGSGSPIILTPEADEVHFEGELVIVIGCKARKVSPQRALDYVLGYTCGNDVSEKGSWEKDFSHWRSKGVPTWGPVGPVIATDVDPKDLPVTIRFNHQVEHRFNTGEMLHDVPEIVSYISRYATLFPGDLIFTGTSGESKAMRPGDLIAIEIAGIGILSNPVIMER